jgi:hypothetical protein
MNSLLNKISIIVNDLKTKNEIDRDLKIELTKLTENNMHVC